MVKANASVSGATLCQHIRIYMTGKFTAKNGLHGTRIGAWVENIVMANEDWAPLERLIERPITEDEKTSISDNLSVFASMCKEYNSEKVSAQDVKATLEKISKLPDEDVYLAVNQCDGWTEERLICALWRMGEKKNVSVSDHPPAYWKAAAMLARAEFPRLPGGAPVKWYREPFARYAVDLWKETGRTDIGVWELEGDASPLVVFATRLLELIETDPVAGSPDYSTVAKLLRKVTS